MSTLIPAGQTGALDHIDTSQGQFRTQIALLITKVLALEAELNGGSYSAPGSPTVKARVVTLEQS